MSIQAQILNLLKDLQKELGLTLLFVGHGLGAVNYVSDRIAVMYLGKIVEIGEAKEIFAHPVHPYTQALLDAVPIPDPAEKRKEHQLLQGEIGSKDQSAFRVQVSSQMSLHDGDLSSEGAGAFGNRNGQRALCRMSDCYDR